jgi:putative protein-disulfide isomerase
MKIQSVILLLISLCLLGLKPKSKQKLTFIYVFDPMCSWSYAFNSKLMKLKEVNPDIDIKPMAGGLATGAFCVSVKDGYKSILNNELESVKKNTGTQFGDKYLSLMQQGDYVYNSVPATKALIVFRSFNTGKEFEYINALQTAFYNEGKSLNELSTFIEVAHQFEIDGLQFFKRFQHPDIAKQAKSEFDQTAKLGVNNFPTLLLETDAKPIILVNGFMHENELEKIISQLK